MKTSEIKAGGVYRGGNRKQVLRLVTHIDNDLVVFDYCDVPQTGKYQDI